MTREDERDGSDGAAEQDVDHKDREGLQVERRHQQWKKWRTHEIQIVSESEVAFQNILGAHTIQFVFAAVIDHQRGFVNRHCVANPQDQPEQDDAQKRAPRHNKLLHFCECCAESISYQSAIVLYPCLICPQ